jgi:FkbM family methyltransferase
VVGVEPQPASLIRARANLLLNDLPDNVRLVAGALGASQDFLPMAPAPSHNSGAATFLDAGGERRPFQIPVWPLGGLLRRLGVGRPDLFLLDVEGFELEALRGVEPDAAPRLVVVECKGRHLERAGATEEALFERLAELGYRCFDLHGRPAAPGDDLVEFNVVGALDGRAATFV